MRSTASFIAALVVASISFSVLADRTATAWGKVLVVSTGEDENRLRIKTTFPFYDVGCAPKDREYTTDPKSPHARLLQDLLLHALSHGNEVQLILDGCYKGLPRIVDVYVLSNDRK